MTAEMMIFQESGYIMSDAAREVYAAARYGENKSIKHSIEAARKASNQAHKIQLKYWGSLDDYVQAHALFPDEIGDIAPRSLISFTTNPDILGKFYTPGRGIVLTREVTVPYHPDFIIPQKLEESGESEVLVLNMISKLHIIN